MPYLTFDEFKDLGFTEIEETEFNKLLFKASAILDNVTNHFYQRCDIKKDNSWRVRQFKLGLCSQIEYFHETRATTSEGMNSAPQTFSAGRTSVSNASKYSRGRSDERKSIVSDDVFMYLSGTGLLYAGVATW